eukprot:tig00000093_g3677.t1
MRRVPVNSAARVSAGALLAAVALLALLEGARAHGYLRSPVARARLAKEPVFSSCPNVRVNWCDHCLQGGGPDKVYPNGAPYPSGAVHGVCGSSQGGDSPLEYVGSGTWGYKGVLAADYAAGSVIGLEVAITAYHAGYFEFHLCPLDGQDGDVTEECLGRYPLPCEGSPYCVGTRFYIHSAPYEAFTEASRLYRPRVRLPAGITSQHAVLRFHYTTGNSCNDPFAPAAVLADPAFVFPYLPRCGSGPARPEEFWNCADVRITAAGGPVPGCGSSAPPPPRPRPPSPAPTSTPAPTGTPLATAAPAPAPALPTPTPAPLLRPTPTPSPPLAPPPSPTPSAAPPPPPPPPPAGERFSVSAAVPGEFWAADWANGSPTACARFYKFTVRNLQAASAPVGPRMACEAGPGTALAEPGSYNYYTGAPAGTTAFEVYNVGYWMGPSGGTSEFAIQTKCPLALGGNACACPAPTCRIL